MEYLTFYVRGGNLKNFSVVRVTINGEFWGWFFPSQEMGIVNYVLASGSSVSLRTMSSDNIQIVADVRADATTASPVDGINVYFRARGVNSGVDYLTSEITGQKIFIAPYDVKIWKTGNAEYIPLFLKTRGTVGGFMIERGGSDTSLVALKSLEITSTSPGDCLFFYEFYDQAGNSHENYNILYPMSPADTYTFTVSAYASELCQPGELYSFQLTNFTFDGPLGEYTVPKTITYWVEIQ